MRSDAVIHLPTNVVISAAGKVTRIDTLHRSFWQITVDAGPVHGLRR